MQSFIISKPYEPHHVVRGFQFPYRIGTTKDDKHMWNPTIWRPQKGQSLTTNLKTGDDHFAVHEKLFRLGEMIREQKLPIADVSVTPFEGDVLEVTISDEAANDPEIWRKIASLLSTSFGLPVKL